MGVNLYNKEGYVDSTAYEAIKNIENERKKSKKNGGVKDDGKSSKDLLCIQKRKM
ncbi:hypothetical protein [Clostridium sp. DL1XJH146]